MPSPARIIGTKAKFAEMEQPSADAKGVYSQTKTKREHIYEYNEKIKL